MRSNLVDVEMLLIAETDKAIKVSDGCSKEWLPKSQIEFFRKDANTHIVTMPEWLAQEKGFI